MLWGPLDTYTCSTGELPGHAVGRLPQPLSGLHCFLLGVLWGLAHCFTGLQCGGQLQVFSVPSTEMGVRTVVLHIHPPLHPASGKESGLETSLQVEEALGTWKLRMFCSLGPRPHLRTPLFTSRAVGARSFFAGELTCAVSLVFTL